MTESHAHRRLLGAYVLGALDPLERHQVEQHLDACQSCRDELVRLSALPQLLDRLEADEAAQNTLALPSTLQVGLGRAVELESRRLRRQLSLWRAATATACLVAVLVWAPWSGPGSDRDRLSATASPTAIAATLDGTADAIAWQWGTTVELSVTGLPPADTYALWAVSRDGRRESAGSWGPTATQAARVAGATAILRDDLDRVEITDPNGLVLATFSYTD